MAMNKAARYFLLLLLVSMVGVGHYLCADFWPQLLSFSLDYHPHAVWAIGWVAIFALMPTTALGFVITTIFSDAAKTKFRATVRVQCVSFGATAVAMAFVNEGDSFLFWIACVLPYAVVGIGILLGLSATMAPLEKC